MKVLRSVFYPLTGIALLQAVYYYPQLPDIVASHFDGRGVPNGWSGKLAFFALYLAIVLLLIGVFDWMPKWMQSRPGSRMKIPNPEYWLAPERRAQTWIFFRRQMLWMGIAHLCLAIFAVQLAILANFVDPPRLHASIRWGLGAYFVIFAVWMIHFFMRFKKP